MKSSVLLLVACPLIATTLCAAEPQFLAGAATSVITPPLAAADRWQFHRTALDQRA